MDYAKKGLFAFYWVMLIVCCLLIYQQQLLYASIVRATLMPILFVYLLVSLKRTHSRIIKILFLSSVGVSWVGDIFRIMNNETTQMVSVANYSIANILYIVSLKKIRKIKFNNAIKASIAFLLLAIATVAMFYNVDRAHLGNLYFPFLLYAFSIVVLASFAANILDSRSRERLASHYFLPGAFLFFLSFSTLMIIKYYIDEPQVDAVVLLLYGYGHSLYINGFRKTARE